MRGDGNERLTILSEAEKTALYGIPGFDDFQRVEFFAMSEAERSLGLQRRGVLKQLYCLLQIGYFKAKQAFFQFSLDDVPPEDVTFLLQRYFPGETLIVGPLNAKEYYAQRREIVALSGYRLWTDNDLPALRDKAALLARTDVTPPFLLAELMVFLIGQRIVRPGYSTLQAIIRGALSAERERLEQAVEAALTDATREVLQQLLVHESTLSDLAAIKQDAKSFRYRQMGLERQKRLTLAPLGTMYDDASNGDAVAGDNKFTVTLPVNESNPKTINYRASAAYIGVMQREQSTVFSVTVVPPLNITVSPGQTEIFIQQGATASTAFTLALQNQSGQPATMTAVETINPNTGLGLVSDYPPGGWTTSVANQTFLIQNTFTGQTPGDYTVTVGGNVMVGGNSKGSSAGLLVHVLPVSGGGNLNLSSSPSGLRENATTSVLFAATFSNGPTAPSSMTLDEVDASGNILQGNVAALADNGSGGDTAAGDGIYSGTASIIAGSAGTHRHYRTTGQFSGGGSPIQSSIYDLQVVPYTVGFLPGNPSSVVGTPEPADGTTGIADVTGQYYCDQVMVIFKPGTPFSVINAAAASVNGSVSASEPALNAYQLAIPCNGTGGVQAAIAALSANPSVESAAPNVLVPLTEVIPSDTNWGLQYAPAKVRADEAWVIGRGGTSIAIVDTGVDYNHPDLSGKVTNGHDYYNNDADSMDDHSHGTHCAGIAAAKGNNALGIAGIAWNSNILAVKVCSAGGSCPGSAIASGILYAQSRAKIISMSLGGSGVDRVIQTAVANAVANGNLVIAAAGNTGNSVPQYPCSYPGVLCVGSTTSTDARSSFSTFGPQVDIAAPGSSIYSTIPVSMGSYGYKSGTSMATPLAAGIAGLTWSRFPTWTAAQVQARLVATGMPLPGLQIGPRVDAFDALFNGNFEDGLNGWSVTGTGSAVTALGPIAPTKDKTMGMASTGPDATVSQSELYQSFTVQAGVSNIPVKFSYAMITEEYPEWVGSSFNDNLRVILQKPDGSTAQLAYESVNGSSFTAIGGINFPGGDSTVGWTGWKNVNLTVPITAGPGIYRITVRDEGDAIYDTNMVVDNIRFK